MEIKNTINLDTNSLVKESLSKAFSYQDYREQVATHVEYGTSSGPDKSEALSNYTLLNNSRMKRLDKTMKIEEDVLEKFKQYHKNVTWLVLTESWCGDAAHAMPVMNKLVEQAKNLDLKILYRDENKELMNRFLTNGTMSIPKLIAFDNETQEVINDWGPSPLMIMNKTKDFKAANATLTTEFKKEIQIWYNQNKGKCIARDLLKLIE
ncbi:thioredoxin family protein [Flavobacteriaceae bacterium]|jgi:thiol-disulfide isomerase/thioredoxin|nr:thioredoxin family protein [Flavobacteriaceae bacterium]MDA9025541.1 thioredoxin family protein [bacterium]MDB9913786.1 thioredoxin family protein [Flavobacteriaceae bacterium]MDB9989525.1 thioredoxin family protein [Flavobacteriaceae bacterium]MDB9993090.1 thioredoxin family protein [Flavobacteriaceae bacterium]|tara:strand:- start:642 stop:1265 length:624 start_codon:yes stop_codon:yes gene_type:complete